MDEAHYLGLMHFARKVLLEKAVLCKRIEIIVGIGSSHTHVHLIPLNEMDETILKKVLSQNLKYIVILK
jgi:histidine triad (HIT) family protein